MALTWLDDVSEYYDACMTSDRDDAWQDIQVAHVTADDCKIFKFRRSTNNKTYDRQKMN